MIEGHHIHAINEVQHGLLVVVSADPNIVDHQRGTVIGVRRQDPQVDSQSDRSLLHHPRELATTDDTDRREVIDYSITHGRSSESVIVIEYVAANV